ncbi:undecaprenyl/decaprenyl-phosphate alpha-N-acetylglucosaminyl 1-phosphate transferase [Fodinisporobacter ferrooxydans]|uniref:Undecaprenyl/decaprenyl-phosphate alpha-N-acetylglucosaminyl 1-phosphate transferase n=1 Tax=Fodinisporobacter ferrooxydans TaxID=2901836 RepID=A0ABY4CP22_9BACL|nr:undecaprenyl/decaprenyl-phosphate alpha-N-acetylglucosaminyl 1-phosphate transferase [Alicyclobacillaceae bacterium MYW30-H2]
MTYVYTFVLAFAIVYALVPFLRKVALKLQFVDLPNHRKIHKAPIPLMGGVALFIGFVVTALIIGDGTGRQWSREFLGMFLGGSIVFFTGFVDDFFKTRGIDFPAWPKFIMQFAAAGALIWVGNIRIEGFNVPFGLYSQSYYTLQPWLQILVTCIWVVGITNMMNFLDGVDGLAAGISSISSTTLFFIAILKGQTDMAVLAITLIGVSLAFLRHNFHPARIFMGDSGALFLGFMLSSIAVDGAFKSATLISVLVPVLALGVPIFDFFYVMLKRVKERKPLHVADKGHTFHQLMRSGMSQIQTVTFLYLLGICFSLASIVVLLANR